MILKMHHGKAEVIGIGYQLAQGIKAGTITNLGLASHCILAAIHNAEKESGINVENVTVSVSGSKIKSHEIVVKHNIKGNKITDKDIEIAKQEAIRRLESEEYEFIHIFATEYIIDNSDIVDYPINMYGNTITIKIYVVTLHISAFVNIQNCLGECHVNAMGFTLASYASSVACISNYEMESGAIIVDIGAHQTDLCIFKKGIVYYTDSVALGGDNITKDIAWGLSVGIQEAERIKSIYGTVTNLRSEEFETIDFLDNNSNIDHNKRTRAYLTSIIRARMEEILGLVQTRLQSSKYYQHYNNKIILTGGTTQLLRVEELAQEIFNTNVKVVVPTCIDGLDKRKIDSSLSTAIGMAKLLEKQYNSPIMSSNILDMGVIRRIFNWFRR